MGVRNGMETPGWGWNMNKYLMAAMVVLLGAALVADTMAGNRSSGKKPTGEGVMNEMGIKGRLSASTNEQGAAVVKISLKSGVIYNVVGSSLIQNINELIGMNGAEIVTKGEVKEVDGKQWLTVEGLITRADGAAVSRGKEKKKKK
jgi:hypothetical protein